MAGGKPSHGKGTSQTLHPNQHRCMRSRSEGIVHAHVGPQARQHRQSPEDPLSAAAPTQRLRQLRLLRRSPRSPRHPRRRTAPAAVQPGGEIKAGWEVREEGA
eukprot:3126087-Pyramimonas_sp.AAC.1